MTIFYPFIYKKEEKNKQIPLYIELIPSIPEENNQSSEEKDEPEESETIIDIF